MPFTYRSRALTAAGTAVPRRSHRNSRPAVAILATAAVAALGLGNVQAATVVWDGGTTGTGSTWLTGANWNPDTTDLGPGVNDLAQFGVAGTAVTIGINPNNPTNNGT